MSSTHPAPGPQGLGPQVETLGEVVADAGGKRRTTAPVNGAAGDTPSETTDWEGKTKGCNRAPVKRPAVRRLSPYGKVIDQLDLDTSLRAGLERNDLLPPRPDDRAGNEVGARFIAALKRSMADGSYEADRALLVSVAKPKYATRPAALLTLADRVVYHALIDPLRPRIERGLVSDRALLWPRAEDVDKRWTDFETNPLSVAGKYVVRADVSGFYETVDHDLLGQRLTTLTGKVDLVDVLVEFLGQVMGEPRGLPQGLAASDALATAYLSGVDAGMLRTGHYYWRHGDDIRMTVPDHDAGRHAVHQFEEHLRAMRLLLNADKTRVLRRETYERQLGAVDEERTRVAQALTQKRARGLLHAPAEEIERLVQEAGVDEETQWGLFYHGNISLEDIVEQLRPRLEPDQVDIAVATYDEAIRRAPDAEAPDALAAEMFHGILTTSFTRLIAARHPRPLKDATALVSRFPDETELVATYLRAVAATQSTEVARETTAALTGGYLTGWQQAWLLQVLREVVATAPDVGISRAVEAASSIAVDENASWLARAEAARLLAQAGQLTHELLVRLWSGCPAAVRADLAAAVGIAARPSAAAPPPWAEAFLDSLAAEPMLQVVLARIPVTDSSAMSSSAPPTGSSPETR